MAEEAKAGFTERKRTKFLALPLYFMKYIIDEEKICIKRGLFSTTQDNAMMYKIQDVQLKRSFLERIFGLGTVICYTGDVTHAELKIEHVRKPLQINEFIISASEAARLKRRTVHTLDIDAYDTEDTAGV